MLSVAELIDTLWNVNGEGIRRWSDGERELIDTLWNVNEEWGRRMASELRELIDTLWNVNVEHPILICTKAELIDTLWNVNCSSDKVCDIILNLN